MREIYIPYVFAPSPSVYVCSSPPFYRPSLNLHLPFSFAQYQLALFQIDSMRKDGRFVGVDGSIPEGQGIIMANLNECHELVEMVRHWLLSPSMSMLSLDLRKPLNSCHLSSTSFSLVEGVYG